MPDSKLSALPAGGAIGNADLWYSDQAGSSVKQPSTAISTYINAHLAAAGLNKDIQFNNSGSFGGDANLTWTVGSGFLDLLHSAFGNFGAIDQLTFAPGDPVNTSSGANRQTLAIDDNLVGDFSTDTYNSAGLCVFNGWKNTGASLLASGVGVQVWNTLNSDSTPVGVFRALDFEPVIYANCTSFSALNGQAFVQGSTVGSLFGMQFSSAVSAGSTITTQVIDAQFGGSFVAAACPAFTSVQVNVPAGGGVITNCIGVDIADFSARGATISYNLRSKGMQSINAFEGAVLSVGRTFANRPATPVAGMICYFTDSTTNVWGAIIAGLGGNKVLGWYNGTNWTVLGA